jgi:hypothetical protein
MVIHPDQSSLTPSDTFHHLGRQKIHITIIRSGTMPWPSRVGLLRSARTSRLTSKHGATKALNIPRAILLRLISTWCEPLPLINALMFIFCYVLETDCDLLKYFRVYWSCHASLCKYSRNITNFSLGPQIRLLLDSAFSAHLLSNILANSQAVDLSVW